MKTIIVPTDFSEYAENALNFAIQLAPKMNSKILLLHVVDYPPLVQTLYMESYGVEQLFKEAKEQAEKKMDKIREQHKSELINSAVFQGKIPEVINEIDRRYEAQLIVMGTKGASGLKETFIGSNTEKVIRNAHIPVISIQKNTEISEIKNVVIPTNGRDDHEGFFRELQKLQNIFNAKVNILFINALHAFENEEEIQKKLMAYAEKAGLRNFEVSVIKAVTPEDGIENFVESNEIDMVAITTHGRHGLSHLLYGSLAESLANHLDVPVFSYNLKTSTK